MYRPIFFAPPDMAEHRHEFEQQFKRLVQLAMVPRLTALANDPIPLGNAKPKWHQSGIFIEDIEAHGVSPCHGTLRAVP
jgi:hypothetical protein